MNGKVVRRFEPSPVKQVKIIQPDKDIASIVLYDVPRNLSWVSLRVGMEWIRISHLEKNKNLLESILCDGNKTIPVSIANFCEVYLEFHWEPQTETKKTTVKVPVYSEEVYPQRNSSYDGGIVYEPIITGYEEEIQEEPLELPTPDSPAFEVTWVDPDPGVLGFSMFIYEDYLIDPKDTEYTKKLRDYHDMVELEDNHVRLKNVLYASHGMMGRKYSFGLKPWVRELVPWNKTNETQDLVRWYDFDEKDSFHGRPRLEGEFFLRKKFDAVGSEYIKFPKARKVELTKIIV